MPAQPALQEPAHRPGDRNSPAERSPAPFPVPPRTDQQPRTNHDAARPNLATLPNQTLAPGLAARTRARVRVSTRASRRTCSSPPARPGTPFAGRSSTVVSPEYPVFAKGGLAASHAADRSETRKFREQVCGHHAAQTSFAREGRLSHRSPPIARHLTADGLEIRAKHERPACVPRHVRRRKQVRAWMIVGAAKHSHYACHRKALGLSPSRCK